MLVCTLRNKTLNPTNLVQLYIRVVITEDAYIKESTKLLNRALLLCTHNY